MLQSWKKKHRHLWVYWLLHTTCYVCGVNACSYLGSSVTLTLFLATRYLN